MLDWFVLLEPFITLGIWAWLVLVGFGTWSFLGVGLVVCLIWGVKIGAEATEGIGNAVVVASLLHPDFPASSFDIRSWSGMKGPRKSLV